MIYKHFNTVHFRLAGDVNERHDKNKMIGWFAFPPIQPVFIFKYKGLSGRWGAMEEGTLESFLLLTYFFLSGFHPLPAVSSFQPASQFVSLWLHTAVMGRWMKCLSFTTVSFTFYMFTNWYESTIIIVIWLSKIIVVVIGKALSEQA